MRLAEAFGGALAGIPVHLHLLYAEPGAIQMPFQGRAFEYAGCCPAFLLQNEDNLLYGTFRHFLFQLNCLLQDCRIVVRELLGKASLACCRL